MDAGYIAAVLSAPGFTALVDDQQRDHDGRGGIGPPPGESRVEADPDKRGEGQRPAGRRLEGVGLQGSATQRAGEQHLRPRQPPHDAQGDGGEDHPVGEDIHGEGAATRPASGLTDATGAVTDPGAVVTTPDGSSTYAGALDAAIVRIAP